MGGKDAQEFRKALGDGKISTWGVFRSRSFSSTWTVLRHKGADFSQVGGDASLLFFFFSDKATAIQVS